MGNRQRTEGKGSPRLPIAECPTSSPGSKRQFRKAVLGLGLTQVVAWGCIYYPVSVTGPLVARDLGVSLQAVYAAYSTLLIASAVAAPWVGRSIDRHGGRPVLSAGAVVAAIGLALTAEAGGLVTYILCSLMLGLAAAMTLYDAAFPALVEAAHPHGRRAITLVTFMGGFASTLSWPVTAFLADHAGWRGTYLVYAGAMLLVCVPVNALALGHRRIPVTDDAGRSAASVGADTVLAGRARRHAFLIFASTVAANQFVASGFLMHIIDVAKESGIGGAQAIALGMLFGPSQVLARVGEMAYGLRFPALLTGRFAMACLALGLAFLVLAPASFGSTGLFVVALGVSNGLVTIARGTITLALFGPAGYGAILGKLTVPTLAARAAGPFAFAFANATFGLTPTILAGLLIAVASVVGMELVSGIARRAQ